jgi:hypothetical protein
MTNELIPFAALTPTQFQGLADVPPELEWLANIANPKTRRVYKRDVEEFSAFTGLKEPHCSAHDHSHACHRLAQVS